MKISRKLFIGFAVVILLSVLIGVMGFIGMNNLHQSGISMYEEQVVGMDNLRNAKNHMNQSIIDLRTVAFMSLHDDRQGVLVAGQRFEDNAAAFESGLRSAITIDELDVLYQPIIAEFRNNFLPNSREIIALSIENIPGHARMLEVNVLMAGNTEIIERLESMIDALSAAHTAIADYTVLANGQQRNVFFAMQGAFVVAAILVGVILSVLITKSIIGPLNMIRAFMTRAGETGDIAFGEKDVETINKYREAKDEIGQTIMGASTFVTHVTNIAEDLKILTSGDFSNDVNLLSDKDTMGASLKELSNNLNAMFSEINTATAQVSSGSKQIADGSQLLAQGSTEQAASVQQLSSSIQEIAQNTKANADMAEKAAILANDIKGSAEKGSRQMDEMMTAVKDISASSQNISKVIKSIDDIAFQTNILALNAAVEAARAGQHGKGFAVVAEEVRNLAAKSAEAAKDTESLIADSIEKAELGSRIADDTAASLTEIVNGIGESTQLVNDIAKSSEQQSVSISQLNTGIDQVAQATQQNSATAEESAAASQEMSSQSILLEELISRFKLKDSDGMSKRIAPPAQGLPVYEQGTPDEAFGKY